jgi:hypothetical protein
MLEAEASVESEAAATTGEVSRIEAEDGHGAAQEKRTYTVKKAIKLLDVPSRNTFLM